MLKILVRLYLILLVTYGAASYLVPEALLRVFDERYNRFSLELMNGPLKLAQRTFAETPPERWPALLEGLNADLAPVSLELLSPDDARLTLVERQALATGAPRVRLDDYGAIGVAIAPLRGGQVLWVSIPDAPMDIALTYWAMNALIGAALLICLYVWLRPHWRDLERLRRTAARLGKGHLGERTAISPRSDIGEVARAFDDMAQELEALIVQQRDLLNAVSHELRTPLSRLEFGLALLQADPLPAATHRQLEQLVRHVRELDALVNELLSFARLQSSQQPPERLSLELEAFLDSVLADFAEEQERRGVEVHLELAAAPARAELAPRLTARALQNLVGNAMRYCQQQVWVTVRREGEELLIAVEDDGEGIPEAERERVFEPFYRLDRSRDRATGGFGLGLAISRRAIENQGGRLGLTSGMRGGALFEIRLPLPPRAGLA
ncbi:ATP-binding protein [Pseudomonas oryzihabitans]|uniref:ATP-binding protein n=1 Tax=Pseudomonas oryzihabitans TaxID=47885 RepID=UPI002895518B|nr:ATP-binding protein [Pseudomonas oryzihabitans]MDT3721256.1 ATP-binding protein [Pseudomonas oryzihabitans]